MNVDLVQLAGHRGRLHERPTVDQVTAEVIRGAMCNIAGNLFFSGTGITPASLLVDSGSFLSTTGTNDLIATNGTFSVTVDSASTLHGGDMQFGGSGSNTTLLVTNGSAILVSSFESADEPGAVSTIKLNGTNSSIHWDNVFYLAGDIGHAGGTADMTIAGKPRHVLMQAP